MMQDRDYMQRALALAAQAEAEGEVPIGAIVVYQDQIIGEGYNQPIQAHDPTAHAEIIALRQAALVLNNYRLPGVTLYVTLEPCPMCAGAMVHSRIARLVYAAADPKSGAAGSVCNLVQHPQLNHRVEVDSGIFAEQASQQLKDFFKGRR